MKRVPLVLASLALASTTFLAPTSSMAQRDGAERRQENRIERRQENRVERRRENRIERRQENRAERRDDRRDRRADRRDDRRDRRVIIRDRSRGPVISFGAPGYFVRTLPTRYRTVFYNGRNCRITVTRRVTYRGNIVTTERRKCPGRPAVVIRSR